MTANQATLDACRALLAGALAGNITGVAAIVILKRGKFSLEIAGDAVRHATFARGALRSLDDALGEHVEFRSEGGHTTY